jgi:phytoene dehydrogenase-like protein
MDVCFSRFWVSDITPQSKKRDVMAEKKMIIIGGGVAGLSAGIYGQMNGFSTQVLEMHSIPGGQCTAWQRGGYHFDYCLQWLVGSRRNAFHDIWKETHVMTKDVKVIDSDVYSLTEDERFGKFYLYTDIDRWQRYLLEMAPEDEQSIRKMCGHMKKSVRVDPFVNSPRARNWLDYLRMAFRMGDSFFMIMRYSQMSARKYIQALGFENEKLRFFLMKMFGESNFSALVIIMMLGWFHDKNAGYLAGGSLPIAARMARRYKDLGGSLMLDTKVEKILVDNDIAVGVKLNDGRELKGDIVISAADGHSTLFQMLDSKYLTHEFVNAYKNWKLFNPFVQISFGLNGIIESEAVTKSYWGQRFRMGNFNVGDDGYIIMNQTMRDPTLAPKGKTSLIIRFTSAWEDWEKISARDYESEKEKIRQDAVTLLEKHYPGVGTKIEVIDVSTPLTGSRITGVWKGSYEGFLPESNVMAASLPDRLKGLDNFYMIGQWVFPGGGLPPAAQSGKWIVQTICRERHLKFEVPEE